MDATARCQLAQACVQHKPVVRSGVASQDVTIEPRVCLRDSVAKLASAASFIHCVRRRITESRVGSILLGEQSSDLSKLSNVDSVQAFGIVLAQHHRFGSIQHLCSNNRVENIHLRRHRYMTFLEETFVDALEGGRGDAKALGESGRVVVVSAKAAAEILECFHLLNSIPLPE